MSQREVRSLTVRLGASETETWSLEVEIEPHKSCRMRLEAHDGTTWSADGQDVFDCLCQIRNQVEPDGIRLCCNGSRRDAWLSGMLRDMGDGRLVYLLNSTPSDDAGIPQTVAVLDAAPADEVVSLTEQLDHVAEPLGWGDYRPEW
jgi:hypothetical protein